MLDLLRPAVRFLRSPTRRPAHLGGLLAGLAALAISLPASVQAQAPASAKPEVVPLASVKASPEFCDLLDDLSVRPRLDGLLRKLLIQCGRENELGQVRQEVAQEVVGSGEAAGVDVAVNDPSGDAGTNSHTQSETSIAYNPSTGTLCSGYNDSFHGVPNSDGFTGFSRSTDDGASFTDLGFLGANSGGDPSIVWRAADGNFYFTALETQGLGVWSSSDDCLTFQYLGNTHVSGGDDKEILAVDNNPGSPFFGRLYVGWTDFSDARIYLNYSADGGVTWSTAIPLSAAGADVQGAWPAVAPNGDVYVGWLRWNPFPSGPIDIEIARSTDGGDTAALVTNPMTGEVNPRDSAATGNCGRPALNGNIRYLPSPQLTVGPDGTLHTVYSYDADGFNTGDVVDVYYRRSTDSGATWLTEVQLNDDGTSTDQYFPTLSVGDSNIVITAWYDRRLDIPNNLMIDYYQRTSFDGGATFAPSERLSDVSTPVFLDPNLATCYHSDYDQQVQSDSFAFIQWGDDRNVQDGHNDPDVFLDSVALSTDFLVLADPASQEVCAPDDALYTINVPQFQGFTEAVTLAATGGDPAFTEAFDTNPAVPPGSSTLTVSGTGGASAGTHDITVTGTSAPSAIVHDTIVSLDLFDQVPGTPTLTIPADAATDVSLLPTFEWTAATQGTGYVIEVDDNDTFASPDSYLSSDTSFTLPVSLDPVTEYFWRVKGTNICGEGTFSAAFSFTTRPIPPILLVDDDDNTPDVRGLVEAALGALGLAWDVWDTANSDNEPSAAELTPYDIVLWFTGDEFGGVAGPGAAGEADLATWLDSGESGSSRKCLFLSSQDYHFDRGLTPFMQTYLGVTSVTNDQAQTSITGQGPAWDGLGPYTLSYPFSNFSDTVVADATATVSFVGDIGDAALSKDAGTYRTAYFLVPIVAVPVADQPAVLDAVLGFCANGNALPDIFADGFESGNFSGWTSTAP